MRASDAHAIERVRRNNYLLSFTQLQPVFVAQTLIFSTRYNHFIPLASSRLACSPSWLLFAARPETNARRLAPDIMMIPLNDQQDRLDANPARCF